MAQNKRIVKKRKLTMSNAEQTPSQLNEMLIKGYSFHQQGYLEEAKSIYNRILEEQPEHFDALQLAGSIAVQTNDYKKAVEFLTSAIAIQPNLGLVHYNLGIAFHELGNFKSAIASYNRAIILSPNFAGAYSNLGDTLQSLKIYKDAIAAYDKAISIDPGHFEAYANRGNALQSIRSLHDAILSYDQAIKLNPNFAQAYTNRGNVYQELKEFESAIRDYDQAIKINPQYFEAYSNRGNALRKLKKFEYAISSYDQAIKINPQYFEAYSNRGNAYQELGKFEDALVDYDQTIKINPQYFEAYSNRGLALQHFKKFEDAIVSYEQAIKLNPQFGEAKWNKALLKLLLGDYEDGWKLYEWRWRGSDSADSHRNFSQPLWLGEISLKDKVILIHAEQGLGDSIQFCRYISMVEALAPKQILLETPKALISLLSTLKNQVTFIQQGDTIPGFDLHCPMMSLPHAFKTTLDTIPSDIPYLYSDVKKNKLWRDKLGPKKKSRIGIVWSGSFGHKVDINCASRRNIPLDRLNCLFELPFDFHLLQKEIRHEDQLALDSLTQINCHQDELIDFSDTAALVMHMDLVISICTSVAHLSGSLGVKTWVLLPYSADFRWMLNRSDSPWYPTATLFRQSEIDDWDSVVDQVRLALLDFQ